MKKYTITLSSEERNILNGLISKGKHESQRVLNALILLDCDTGEFQTSHSTNEEIAKVLNISVPPVPRPWNIIK